MTERQLGRHDAVGQQFLRPIQIAEQRIEQRAR
jgi:hypothetical protein